MTPGRTDKVPSICHVRNGRVANYITGIAAGDRGSYVPWTDRGARPRTPPRAAAQSPCARAWPRVPLPTAEAVAGRPPTVAAARPRRGDPMAVVAEGPRGAVASSWGGGEGTRRPAVEGSPPAVAYRRGKQPSAAAADAGIVASLAAEVASTVAPPAQGQDQHASRTGTADKGSDE